MKTPFVLAATLALSAPVLAHPHDPAPAAGTASAVTPTRTMNSTSPSSANPLATPSPLPLAYPPFDKISDADIGPALDLGMAEQLREVAAIADNPEPATFDNTIVAFERSGATLQRASTLLFSLVAADSNPARLKLQSTYATRLAEHQDAILLDPRLFARVDALYQQRARLENPLDVRLVERHHNDLVRAGARLDAAAQAQVKAINGELAALGARFNENVLAEVNDAAVVVDRVEDLAGLGDEQISAAAAAATHRGLEGKYVIALLNTTGQPVLSQLQNRALRQRIHEASMARGSRGNALDNTALVARTAALRAQRAKLLGFATHADFVLADETANNPQAVNAMLRQLIPAAVAAAGREGADLQAMIDREQAARKQPTFPLAAWDWSFYNEKVRAEKYGFDEAQLKPYLELKNVLENGVFYAAGQLYGITLKQRHDLPVYHPDVQVYDVFDADGSQLAIFIADMYARPSKRGGAWMNAFVEQNGLRGDKPVVGNFLNIPKPADGKPTLLTWDEVITAFHEFGHALHGMFSATRYPSVAGTHVPRDFVEYPSQVNEMWADWPEVLAHYAKHHETGAPMPRALLDKLQAAGQFNQGFRTTEYLSAAILDQRWHQLSPDQVPAADGVMAFEARVLREEGAQVDAVPPRYRTPYFSHIMGGYAAGYYAYIWSEVLDANTVTWFKTHGGLQRKLGDTLRTKLLSQGSSQDALVLFRSVVGHGPEIQPLLERRGLVTAPATATH